MKNERCSNKDERIKELIRSLQEIKLQTHEIFAELEALRVEDGANIATDAWQNDRHRAVTSPDPERRALDRDGRKLEI